MKTNRLYFLDVTRGYLYTLNARQSRVFLKKHPNWRALLPDDHETFLVSEYFKKQGKVLAAYSDENLSASYV